MDLKQAVCGEIDRRRKEIIEIGEQVLRNPEMGFKEVKTAGIVKEAFSRMGLGFQDNLAVTGVKAWGRGRSSRLKVCIMGELDAVICPQHPYANPVTGAAHSCGHNAQIASMLGAAFGLVLSGVMDSLDGDACFFAVPAEEYVEMEYRERLKQEGRIAYFGGKQELLHLGAFDDIDMAMMVHAQAGMSEAKVGLYGGSMGFVGKTVRFAGREAHAGGAPHEGINALNAAMAAIMCIHAQRETFRDEDGVRVHPILTKGGDLVNIVPADVRMETFVRAKNIPAMTDACRKVDRAIRGGSYAIGAEVRINHYPGYLPLQQSRSMGELFEANAVHLLGEQNIIRGLDLAGSTDAGDLSAILPSVHVMMGGFTGLAHSKDFRVADPEAAYILPAKLMAMTVVDLLSEEAGKGRKICSEFKGQAGKSSYGSIWDSILPAED